MSIHDIEVQILSGLGIIIGSMIVYLLERAAAWMGVKVDASRHAALEIAVDRSMTLGVSKAEGIITERGWDHVDSQNAVINYALTTIGEKFKDTLSRSGIDPTTPGGRSVLYDMMARMWPDVATRLSASPATPPSATPAAAVVSAPTAG